MSRLATLLVAACVSVWTHFAALETSASAQPPAEPSSLATEDAGDASAGASLSVLPAGSRRHVAGRWATLAVNGMNRSNVDVEETSTVMIGDDTNLQFARKLWIPAGATRQSWLPVQIPAGLDPADSQVSMRSIHLRESDEGEQYQSNAVGMPTSQRSLLLSWEASRTGIVIDALDPDEEYDGELQASVLRTLYAGRDRATGPDQDLGIVQLSGSFIPPSPKAFDPLDQIVIANDRILGDTAAVTHLRGWLHSGGRLWIMVDQVDPDAVRALLGDAVCYSVVDRVELNDFEIEQVVTANSSIQKAERETWSSETPVELVRVLAETEDIHSQIDGWPAAFWIQVGHGEVLFTTLGPTGWINESGQPTGAMANLSTRFFLNRIEPPRHTTKIASFLDAEIGYRIPSRASVAGVLGLHMLVVLVAGLWLARRQNLQYLAIVVPLAALVATGSLVAIGNQQTSAVPSTIAIGQIARAIPESSLVQVNSVASIYSQDSRPLRINSSAETTTRLVDGGDAGEMRRVQWDDSGESNWLFVTQPPGVVRHVESESIVALPQPWSFKGRFTERGFEARIGGLDADDCEDAVIIAAAAPALAVDFDSASAGFVASGFDDVLSPDQYIDAKLMSDVQQDRQELLRDLMSAERSIFDGQPTLLVWTDPIEAGVTFDEDFVRRGSTLASIPVHLERLPSGMDFRVPASFVRLGTRGASMVFNAETGRWLDEMNRPAETELRCVPPKVLLPCQLNRATVLIKINAPSRTLQLKGLVDGQFVTLHRKENPSGLLSFDINRADALQLDADGGLLLSIEISATEEERLAAAEQERRENESRAARLQEESEDPKDPLMPSRSTWQIDYVHVNLEGTSL